MLEDAPGTAEDVDVGTTNEQSVSPERPPAPWSRTLFVSDSGETSLLPPGMRFLTNEKITHFNFQDGCCVEDQQKSSRTAVDVAKMHHSLPKNATHLTPEFRMATPCRSHTP